MVQDYMAKAPPTSNYKPIMIVDIDLCNANKQTVVVIVDQLSSVYLHLSLGGSV